MRAESNVKPKSFEINIRDSIALITFCTNIKEEKDDENIKYVYDMYELKISNRDTLNSEIERNYEEYLFQAINYEKNKSNRAVEERNWRNSELDKTDKYLLEDFPVKYEKNTILKYREALREYPEQEGFPYEAIRPKIEDFI